jgi:hypothetical protein
LQAIQSPADELFYGGAAGGGKTDLLLGVAQGQHTKSMIFRRTNVELKDLKTRSKTLFNSIGSFNKNENEWVFNDGKSLIFCHCQNSGDETKYQGWASDLKGFDELTNFLEDQYRFLIGWNRTTILNQRTRVICTGNPPSSGQGDWVIKYWAPWLDDQHPKPANPGELRWFTTIGGVDQEVESSEPFMYKGERLRPRSRTFIPARLEDNKYYGEDYRARLQAMPEPLRSQLLYGDFRAGSVDHEYQVIPRKWVIMAQGRWRDLQSKRNIYKMVSIGVDVARGGKDRTVITLLHEFGYCAKQICIKGKDSPSGQEVAAEVLRHRKDGAVIHVDVIGVGASVYDALCVKLGASAEVEASKLILLTPSKRRAVIGLVGNGASSVKDKTKQFEFRNKRAEWWWRLREALDPETGSNIAIPDDSELLRDLCTPHWKFTPQGLQIEDKKDIIDRIGRSPDKGDSLIYAFAETTTRRVAMYTDFDYISK